ncbi:hypothetical protein SCODD09_00909 [Streptococcus constellatus]|nr:hypothetical protein SCODD09_00909 [Streptococcus constellatus]
MFDIKSFALGFITMMILTWLDKPIIYFLDKYKKISKK